MFATLRIDMTPYDSFTGIESLAHTVHHWYRRHIGGESKFLPRRTVMINLGKVSTETKSSKPLFADGDGTGLSI